MDREEAKDLRVAVKAKIRVWGLVSANDSDMKIPSEAGIFLARLFDFPNYAELRWRHDAELHKKFLLLNGPNGYALLKAMMIQKGL